MFNCLNYKFNRNSVDFVRLLAILGAAALIFEIILQNISATPGVQGAKLDDWENKKKLWKDI